MKRKHNRKYYVMFGFEEENPKNTAYLKIEKKSNNKGNLKGIYSIVKTVEEATIFPEKNYNRKKGFGNPSQWAKFFAEEIELQDWNFHPVSFKYIKK